MPSPGKPDGGGYSRNPDKPVVMRAESRARLQALGVLPQSQDAAGYAGSTPYDEATLLPAGGGAAPKKVLPVRSGSGLPVAGQATLDELAKLFGDSPAAAQEVETTLVPKGPPHGQPVDSVARKAANAEEVTRQPEELSPVAPPRSERRESGSRPGSRRTSDAGKPPLAQPAAEEPSSVAPPQERRESGSRPGSRRTSDAGQSPATHVAQEESVAKQALNTTGSLDQGLTPVFDRASANKAGDTGASLGQPLAGADATSWPTEKRLLHLQQQQDVSKEAPPEEVLDAEEQARQLNLRSIGREDSEGVPADPDVFGPPRPRRSVDRPPPARVGSKQQLQQRPGSRGSEAANLGVGQRIGSKPPSPPRQGSKPPSPPRLESKTPPPAAQPSSEDVPIAQQVPEHLRQKWEQRERRRLPSAEAPPEQPSMERQASNKREDAYLKAPGAAEVSPGGRSSSVPSRGPPPARGSWSDSPDVRPKGRPLTRPQSVDPGPRKGSQSPGREEEEGANLPGRQMFDKNYLRLHNKERFSAAISKYREEHCRQPSKSAAEDAELAGRDEMIRVYVRKRPLFDKDDAAGDYDAVTVLPASPFPKQLVLHNCLFEADLKHPFITHYTFGFDRVFAEDARNDDVYKIAAAPLVESAIGGRVCTMFMFGQTGSGKTHTMSAIEDMAAVELFNSCDDADTWMQVQFIELCGNTVFDLLVPVDPKLNIRGGQFRRPELRLRESKSGGYIAEGAQQMSIHSAQELKDLLRLAASRRATSATDANSVSSRSHAVCTIQLRSGGRLLLVDCAGTERRKDSMHHSKERQAEGAEINASLHSLKECIRYLTKQHHVPSHVFRASALTKVLAEAFIHGKDNQLAVICTASPGALDVDHTLSTLRTGSTLCLHGSEREEKQPVVKEAKARIAHPKTWTPEQVLAWLGEVANGEFKDVAVPSGFTGQMLVRLTEVRFTQLCDGNKRRGKLLYDLLHEEIHKSHG
mmetsp:Transcript_69749/g.130246  ORF Transcript_69749/g.130246 Transcript_69749/m.130246 type:complete len:979 (-) Transcript_69749:89-3025(-)